jgi:hypothetical protein
MDEMEEFERNLRSLIEKASSKGIEVEQHWTCRTEGDGPDWDVEIVRIR